MLGTRGLLVGLAKLGPPYVPSDGALAFAPRPAICYSDRVGVQLFSTVFLYSTAVAAHAPRTDYIG